MVAHSIAMAKVGTLLPREPSTALGAFSSHSRSMNKRFFVILCLLILLAAGFWLLVKKQPASAPPDVARGGAVEQGTAMIAAAAGASPAGVAAQVPKIVQIGRAHV